MTHPDTLPSSVTETPETDSDRVSEERLRGAARDLLGALQKYGFPVSDAATRQLMDGGSLEAQAVHVAAKGLATALRTTPSLPPRSGGVVGPWGAEDDYEGVLHALEIAGMGAPYSDVQGNLYCARQYSPDGYRDAEFRDYGLARAVRILCNNAARIRSTLADPILEAPADEEVERGWLIELKPSVARQPTWFHLDDEWTTDSTKALRFARKADAEAFIAHSGWTEAFASEHMWGLPASRAALRRSTETDKPGVREAALEEAAKVADMFAADHAKSADQFGIDRNRELHNAAKGAAQGVAFAIRALSAPLAAEQPAADRDGSERYLDWNDPADAIAPLPRSTTGGAK